MIYNELKDQKFNYIVRIYTRELHNIKKYFDNIGSNIIYNIPDNRMLKLTNETNIVTVKENNNTKRKYFLLSNNFHEVNSMKFGT